MIIKYETVSTQALRRRKGIVGDVKIDDMSNGTGVRETIFVAGCLFNCFNCFNKNLQSFNYGKDIADNRSKGITLPGEFPKYYDDELEQTIIDNLRPDYIEGLTLLGGEPFMNTNITLRLAMKVREVFGNKKSIWSWTGYEWEELMGMIQTNTPLACEQARLLNLIDTLVDGRYVDSIRLLDIKRNNGEAVTFRGSSNQRIIDVSKSLISNSIVERRNIYKNEICVKRNIDFNKLTGHETSQELINMGL